MSAPISSTHNNTISPSIIKWIVGCSAALVLLAFGTLLYLAHRHRAKRVPSDEENYISDTRLPLSRPRPTTKIASPVSGVPRGHHYAHREVTFPGMPAMGARPPVRRDKALGGSVQSPGSRLAFV